MPGMSAGRKRRTKKSKGDAGPWGSGNSAYLSKYPLTNRRKFVQFRLHAKIAML